MKPVKYFAAAPVGAHFPPHLTQKILQSHRDAKKGRYGKRFAQFAMIS
jgi:hypothetical protein